MLHGLGRHENGAAQLEESMSVTPSEVATRCKPARLVARNEQKAEVPGDSGWCAATCERRLVTFTGVYACRSVAKGVVPSAHSSCAMPDVRSITGCQLHPRRSETLEHVRSLLPVPSCTSIRSGGVLSTTKLASASPVNPALLVATTTT
eukprot:scaffold43208_cov74-Phaeocystis_antarctica.AAC.12